MTNPLLPPPRAESLEFLGCRPTRQTGPRSAHKPTEAPCPLRLPIFVLLPCICREEPSYYRVGEIFWKSISQIARARVNEVAPFVPRSDRGRQGSGLARTPADTHHPAMVMTQFRGCFAPLPADRLRQSKRDRPSPTTTGRGAYARRGSATMTGSIFAWVNQTAWAAELGRLLTRSKPSRITGPPGSASPRTPESRTTDNRLSSGRPPAPA